MRTGISTHPLFQRHFLSSLHPESPLRLSTLEKKLSGSQIKKELMNLSPLSDSQTHILKIHSQEHLQSIQNLPSDKNTALKAVDYCLGAAKAICENKVETAFCAVRPPGHHSMNNGAHYDDRNHGEGFCFLNNIAIVAKYLQEEWNKKKILIVDWDYHHGNGTEWAFYNDPSVLFFSTHQLDAYPGTGSADRKGEGPGEGYNINAPLGAFSGDSQIFRAFEEKLLPEAEKFKPDFVLISAGFDSGKGDPLGTFNISPEGFAQLSKYCLELAKKYSGGNLLSILEGGYNPEALSQNVVSHLESMLSFN